MTDRSAHLATRDKYLSILFFALLAIDIGKHAVVLLSGLDQPWGDSLPYWIWGGDIASGDLAMLKSQVGYRMLGYPWMIGICRFFAGDFALLSLALVQHALSLSTDLLVAVCLLRITGARGIALLGYALMIANTSRAIHANWVLTESAATFVLFASAILAWSAWETPSIGRLLGTAAMFGVAILVRPSSLILLPFVVPLVMSLKSHRVVGGIGAALAIGLSLAPCYVRNYTLFGTAQLVTFEGRELWAASFSPWPGGELPIPTDGAGGKLQQKLQVVPDVDWRRNWSVSSSLARLGMTDADIDREMAGVAWQAISRDPVRAGSRFLVRLATYWYCWNWQAEAPPESHQQGFAGQQFWAGYPVAEQAKNSLCVTPEWYRWPTVLYSIATWIGLVCMLSRPSWRRAGIVIAYVLLATTVLTAGLEIPTYRYRMPLEPLMMIAISCAIQCCLTSSFRPAATVKRIRGGRLAFDTRTAATSQAKACSLMRSMAIGTRYHRRCSSRFLPLR